MKKALIVVLTVAIAIAGIYVLKGYMFRTQSQSLVISGRVEADEILISTRIPGRLKELYIRDGVNVSKGEPVAKLEEEELKTAYEEVRKSIDALRKSINTQEATLDYLKARILKTIEKSQKALNLSKVRLKQAEANLLRQKKRLERFRKLFKKGVIAEDRFEDIKLAYSTAEGDYNAAVEAVKEAEVSVEAAKVERGRIRIKEKEIETLRQKLASMKERLQAAKIRLSYTLIKAPADGVVIEKVAEPGEVLAAGGVIGIMVRPESIHVKTFIPEPLIGRIKTGTVVRVISDAYPEEPVTGRICYISDIAEFTPKEVQSKQERIKQVFQAKVCFDGHIQEALKRLKKGMPVDVEIPIER